MISIDVNEDMKMKIEKRIVQMHLMYPDTECFVEKETSEEIIYKVVVKK